jgi:predicted metal-dependent TIM-barrel fold hydrolase
VRSPVAFFDAHLHADGLSEQDLESMSLFGVKGALLSARDVVSSSVKDLVSYFEEILCLQAQRLLKQGVRPYAALGVHPGRIPWHGLEEVLAAIPRLASAGRLVALGEIGLDRGGPREEQVLERQLELAREVNLPVLAHTPERDKPRITRRLLAILRASGLAPQSILVGHADARTLRLVRECGFFAGLTLNPTRLTVEAAVDLVSAFGSEGLVASSDSGGGAHDILTLPRAASLLEERGLGALIIRRVLRENALGFLRLPKDSLDSMSPIARRSCGAGQPRKGSPADRRS